MKRILPAAVLAIIFHTALLGVDISWITDRRITMPKSTAVTVTMSYRQPEPMPEVKTEPVKRPEKHPKTPEKIHEERTPMPLESAVQIPEEPEPIIYEEETEPTDREESEEKVSDEDDFPQNSQGDAVSNMRISREAVPLYKKNPPPGYPRTAKKRGYQGTVVLSVLVDEYGRVANLWVFTSSGYMILDNAAAKAVKKWFFEPGKIGTRNVDMWVKVPIRFQLK